MPKGARSSAVERVTDNDEVDGSIPSVPTKGGPPRHSTGRGVG